MTDSTELPDGANFYCMLTSTRSKKELAEWFAERGWSMHRVSSLDYGIRCAWAELVIEVDSPVLIHGAVADIMLNAARILDILKASGASFAGECYDEHLSLLQEFSWSAT